MPLLIFFVKPWEQGLEKVSVFPALSGVSGRDNNVDKIRIAAEKRGQLKLVLNLMSTPTAQHLYGGAGVVITRKNLTSPKVVKTIQHRGACFTCSYEDLEVAVHWL